MSAVEATVLRPRFMGAVRGETIKVTRQLSFWLMLLGGCVLLAVIVLAISGAENLKPMLETDPTQWAYDKLETFGTVFQIGSAIFLLIVGARLFGMEYSSGTIRIAYARGFGRLQLLLAKAFTLVLVAVALFIGYAVIAGGVLVLMIDVLHGSFDPLQKIAGEFWTDAGRWAAVQAVSMGAAIVLAAAAAAIGRSLAFAVAAALAFYPVDNFLNVLELLGVRATGHQHPWVDISQYQLGLSLNVVLNLWEPGHHARPAFAAPLAPVDLAHAFAVIGAYLAVLAAVAIFRTVRPDVLE